MKQIAPVLTFSQSATFSPDSVQRAVHSWRKFARRLQKYSTIRRERLNFHRERLNSRRELFFSHPRIVYRLFGSAPLCVRRCWKTCQEGGNFSKGGELSVKVPFTIPSMENIGTVTASAPHLFVRSNSDAGNRQFRKGVLVKFPCFGLNKPYLFCDVWEVFRSCFGWFWSIAEWTQEIRVIGGAWIDNGWKSPGIY